MVMKLNNKSITSEVGTILDCTSLSAISSLLKGIKVQEEELALVA